MRQARIEKISEGAYFIFEPSSFNGSIVTYDPVVANQPILSDCSFPMPAQSEDPKMSKPVLGVYPQVDEA
jgi:hypothetical protein